jgi:hypothetical protein
MGIGILLFSMHGQVIGRESIPSRRFVIRRGEGGGGGGKMEDIGAAFVNFYQNFFTTQGALGIEECLRGLQPRVTEAMNTKLLCKFEMAEIDNALAQMHPLKSPGPNDFAAYFYQRS